jgi:hypothetical protein
MALPDLKDFTEVTVDYSPEKKVCTLCETEKDKSEFYKIKRMGISIRDKKVTHVTTLNSYCILCHKQYCSDHQKRNYNKEQKAEINRRSRERYKELKETKRREDYLRAKEIVQAQELKGNQQDA